MYLKIQLSCTCSSDRSLHCMQRRDVLIKSWAPVGRWAREREGERGRLGQAVWEAGKGKEKGLLG
jgi:hypothetical protein